MALQVRLKPKFPARVVAGTGMTITNTSGSYTFTWNIASLIEKTSISAGERDNLFIPIYDSDNSYYRVIDIDTLTTSVTAGLDATLVGIAATAPVANEALYFTAADTAATYSLTSSGRALAGITGATDKVPYFTGAGSATTADFTSYGRSVVAVADEAAFKALVNLELGVDVQAYDADLAALAANSTAGFWARTGAGTGAARTLTGTANEISVANGDGSGVPTFSLPAAMTLTGKTVTGGTYSGPAFTSPTTDTLSMSSFVDLTEQSSPSNPSADHLRVFVKDVAGATHLYTRDSGGTEVDLSAAAAAAGVSSLNGVAGVVNAKVVCQVITATGTYTPTSGMKYAIFEGIGGGGAGGGTTSAGGNVGGAGGGGSAGWSRTVLAAATIGASKAVTIGAGGTVGAAGNNAGNAGGDTVVDGSTVTVTIASPGVFSWTGHGLIANQPISFRTTGALPTGLTAGTTYYVISAGLTADAFEVSATVGGSAVNTSGSQSGVHTAQMLVAKGGAGGAGAAAGGTGTGGAGGVAGTGYEAIPGTNGSAGLGQGSTSFGAFMGDGGQGFYGGGTGRGYSTGADNGAAGGGYGSGGQGGGSFNGSGNVTGGAGKIGVLYITEFIVV